MSRGDEFRLDDIYEAAAKLAVRIGGTDYETWLGDEDRRLVTERLVEIIGEAARAMSSEGRAALPDVDWTGLIGLRNVLVHAYHRIQPDLLWHTEAVDIPRSSPCSEATVRPATHPRTADRAARQPDRRAHRGPGCCPGAPGTRRLVAQVRAARGLRRAASRATLSRLHETVPC